MTSPWPEPHFDPLGLAGTWPRPGWVVLDAAREAAFSGEVEFASQPPVRVYFDGGRIYVAERVTDPPVGARLVDAGALDAAELARGTVRIGEVDHLGRLFERAPTVDRTAVLVTLEMMTEEATAWVANQVVRGATVTPYRHHPSGVHRWDAAPTYLDLPPGSPLPAPGPATLPAPNPVAAFTDLDELGVDMRIEWAEPASMHGGERIAAGRVAESPASRVEPTVAAVESPASAAPVAEQPQPVPTVVANDLLDGFEVIWPTGEVDEHFPAPVVEPEPAGAGSSARVASNRAAADDDLVDDLADDEFGFVLATGPSVEMSVEGDDLERPVVSDEVVLAVRRAIAAIETGARQGWAPSTPVEAPPDRGSAVVEPTRPPSAPVDTRAAAASPLASALGARQVAAASPWPAGAAPVPPPALDDLGGQHELAGIASQHAERRSALARLIGGLRRR